MPGHVCKAGNRTPRMIIIIITRRLNRHVFETENRRQADAKTLDMVKADSEKCIEMLLHSRKVVEFVTVAGEEVLRVDSSFPVVCRCLLSLINSRPCFTNA